MARKARFDQARRSPDGSSPRAAERTRAVQVPAAGRAKLFPSIDEIRPEGYAQAATAGRTESIDVVRPEGYGEPATPEFRRAAYETVRPEGYGPTASAVDGLLTVEEAALLLTVLGDEANATAASGIEPAAGGVENARRART